MACRTVATFIFSCISRITSCYKIIVSSPSDGATQARYNRLIAILCNLVIPIRYNLVILISYNLVILISYNSVIPTEVEGSQDSGRDSDPRFTAQEILRLRSGQAWVPKSGHQRISVFPPISGCSTGGIAIDPSAC